MPNGVSQFGKGIVEQELTRMFEPKWIRAAAKESGLIEREYVFSTHVYHGNLVAPI